MLIWIVFWGESQTPGCSTGPSGIKEYNKQTSDSVFTLNFDLCGMYRLRMLNPKGMMYTTTIVVSFHPQFITKVDRAYNVQCFYGEFEKIVHSALNVSMLPTTDLFDNSLVPKCVYSVRQGTLNGPPVYFARIGDKVVHRWECDSDMYGFLVRDCFVDDGRSSSYLLIESNGCTTDPVLLSDLSYDLSGPIAFAESHVFKFADFSRLTFQCQIQICFKTDYGCSGITPPNCGLHFHGELSKKLKKKLNRRSIGNSTAVRESPEFHSDILDVREQLTVFDLDQTTTSESQSEIDDGRHPNGLSSYSSTLSCKMDISRLFATILGTTMVLLVIIFFLVTLARRQKYKTFFE